MKEHVEASAENPSSAKWRADNTKDWTTEDWRDLHEGVNAIKAKIQARHRVSEKTQAQPRAGRHDV